MKTIKTVVAGFGVAITALGLTACTAVGGLTIVADYPDYASVRTLAADSTSIVLGVVGAQSYSTLSGETSGSDPVVNPLAGTGSEALDVDVDALPITVFEISVVTCVKGACNSAPSIKVKQLGGVVDGRATTVEGIEPLVPGETVLLFLEDYDDAPSSILGGDVGFFIERDGRFVSVDNERLKTTFDALKSLVG
ncbi:MAG: hypothetical protein RLZZ587_388 [Actinomycetota bacterium]|jgi:hypothetical protein